MGTTVVVGGGILGAAVARRLLQQRPDERVEVWEKERALAQHQAGRNSGVVHAGLYYEPGSLKATLCRRGVGLLRTLCAEHGLPYREIGKVLVALDDAEVVRLSGIRDRAAANGVPGVRLVDAAELRELEPHVRGVAGLHSPTTAICDYAAVTRLLAQQVEAAGGVVRRGLAATQVRPDRVLGRTLAGDDVEVPADRVVLCAGLHGDRLAATAGGSSSPRIVPFRGEYLLLRPERRDLVRGLVYPVPDPRYPFLGVHLTPRVDGEVLVGPNAVLALAREGYDWGSLSPRDLAEVARYPGFRRFARQHWRTGVREVVGSLSTRAYVRAARRYVPELRVADVAPGPAGVRAQALDDDGGLVDDFRIDRLGDRGQVVAVRNAPSPGATSALAIAEHVVALAISDSA
ncbi:L-2-hydroxyglutarate oxidase [Nocardioides nanhaiensis]|uniref:L-2-hydroxyglutarate oxidase n=1 Tax=Nocardioides nanhaiensis TaxID=1476871 RepID=A0ABP8VUT7_9ACTN